MVWHDTEAVCKLIQYAFIIVVSEHSLPNYLHMCALFCLLVWHISEVLKCIEVRVEVGLFVSSCCVNLLYFIFRLHIHELPSFQSWLEFEAWEAYLKQFYLLAVYLKDSCYNSLILNRVKGTS